MAAFGKPAITRRGSGPARSRPDGLVENFEAGGIAYARTAGGPEKSKKFKRKGKSFFNEQIIKMTVSLSICIIEKSHQ